MFREIREPEQSLEEVILMNPLSYTLLFKGFMSADEAQESLVCKGL